MTAAATPLSPRTWSVWVPGSPAGQGSKVAMPIYSGSKANGTRQFTGKVHIAEQRSAPLATWRDVVAQAVTAAWPHGPIDGPVILGLEFLLAPFKSTKPGQWPTGSRRPDLDKLIRGVGDALTGILYVDDRKIVGYLGYPHTSKRFAGPGEEPGCLIRMQAAPAAAPSAPPLTVAALLDRLYT